VGVAGAGADRATGRASNVAPSTLIPGSWIGCAAPLAGRAMRAASPSKEKFTDDERMTPLRTKERRAAAALVGSKQATAKLARPAPPVAPSARAFAAAIAPETSPARPSTRTQSRRHYGDPFAGAPRVGDGRLVPAGLLARGSKRITPAFPPIGSAVALGSDARRLQLRGQPRF